MSKYAGDDSLDAIRDWARANFEPLTTTLVSKTITANGTYDPASDNADGYSSVTVNVDNPLTELTNYIESSGTQWIDTGYIPTDTSRFELVANVSSTNPSYATVFGTSNGEAGSEIFIYVKNNGNNVFSVSWFFSAEASFSIGNKYYDAKAQYILQKYGYSFKNEDGIKCDGNSISGGTTAAQYPVYLFTWDRLGSDFGSSTHCTMKLYRFRIYEGTILVHEFIPWTDENEVVCLKDTVSGNLKYNAGTGTFTYGTDA